LKDLKLLDDAVNDSKPCTTNHAQKLYSLAGPCNMKRDPLVIGYLDPSMEPSIQEALQKSKQAQELCTTWKALFLDQSRIGAHSIEPSLDEKRVLEWILPVINGVDTATPQTSVDSAQPKTTTRRRSLWCGLFGADNDDAMVKGDSLANKNPPTAGQEGRQVVIGIPESVTPQQINEQVHPRARTNINIFCVFTLNVIPCEPRF
jgi:hypothetical protein